MYFCAEQRSWNICHPFLNQVIHNVNLCLTSPSTEIHNFERNNLISRLHFNYCTVSTSTYTVQKNNAYRRNKVFKSDLLVDLAQSKNFREVCSNMLNASYWLLQKRPWSAFNP